MPEKLVYLGNILPSAIMAVLIVYCLKDIGDNWIGVGIPRLIAVGIVALSYKWKHHTLLSILGGTVCYMILLHIF
jgi:branched-subunit amino acid transport protein AzlD